MTLIGVRVGLESNGTGFVSDFNKPLDYSDPDILENVVGLDAEVRAINPYGQLLATRTMPAPRDYEAERLAWNALPDAQAVNEVIRQRRREIAAQTVLVPLLPILGRLALDKEGLAIVPKEGSAVRLGFHDPHRLRPTHLVHLIDPARSSR